MHLPAFGYVGLDRAPESRFGVDPLSWTPPTLSQEVYPLAKTRAPYAPEFRRQMVDLVRIGRDPDDLAREFEPTAQSIRNWVVRGGGNGRRPPSCHQRSRWKSGRREEEGRWAAGNGGTTLMRQNQLKGAPCRPCPAFRLRNRLR
jgi:transposase-like protein